MTSRSNLVGYLRRSRNGGALRMSIDAEAFSKAERYTSSDGREFVSLIANVDKVQDILSGEREVTSLCQIVDGE
jgi:hypothetical protein